MRKKILLAGAGGAPTEGVVYSLQLNPNNNVIGMGSEPADLILSRVNRKYYVPYANTASYKDKLLNILEKEKRQQIERTHLSTVIHSEKLWRHRVALWLDKAKRKLDMSYGHL